MSDSVKLTVFHGTDIASAEAICSGSFVAKYSSEHWLGNGIYFFLDEHLARWWTTNPTRKFGTKVNTAAIVKCDLELSRNTLFDLTRLDDFEQYIRYARRFLKISAGCPPVGEISDNQRRCMLFDWIFEMFEISAVVGHFYLPNQPYLLPKWYEDVSKFSISYVETQVCVREEEQHLLKNKTYQKIECG